MTPYNPNDPFGINDNRPQPYGQPAPVNSLGSLGIIVVCILVAFAAILAWDKFGPDRDRQQDQDHQEQQDDSVKLTGGYLFFVHERMLPTEAQADILDEAEIFVTKNPSFSFRSIDTDAANKSPITKPVLDYAASKNVSPPMMVVKDSIGKFRNAIAWPATSSDMKAAIK